MASRWGCQESFIVHHSISTSSLHTKRHTAMYNMRPAWTAHEWHLDEVDKVAALLNNSKGSLDFQSAYIKRSRCCRSRIRCQAGFLVQASFRIPLHPARTLYIRCFLSLLNCVAMPRSSKPRQPSRAGSGSSSSSGNSEKSQTLSVNLYGRGDPDLGDPPAHWGAMIHKRGEREGDLYHVRKNNEFFYDHSKRPLESQTSTGRSEIKHFSSSRRPQVAQTLHDYGTNAANLPADGQNCQDWTAGALGAVEQQRLAPPGTGDYWATNVGKSSLAIGDRLQRDGRSWVPKRDVNPPRQTPAAATFGKDQARKPIGRLNLDKFAGLSGGARSGNGSKSK